jgi:hypothetical protein
LAESRRQFNFQMKYAKKNFKLAQGQAAAASAPQEYAVAPASATADAASADFAAVQAKTQAGRRFGYQKTRLASA